MGIFIYNFKPTHSRMRINRTDSIQTETDIATGQVYRSRISWQSPCEFTMISILDAGRINSRADSFLSVNPIRVRVIRTSPDYYVFRAEVDSATKSIILTDTMWIGQGH